MITLLERLLSISLIVTLLAACTQPSEETEEASMEVAEGQPSELACDPDNGGLELPEGFCALVVADSLGRARHMAVNDNGDLYVALRQTNEDRGGSIVALRDTDADGRADDIRYFGEEGGTGIEIHDGYLYHAPDDAVWRYPLTEGELVPSGEREQVIGGLPEQGTHEAKPFAFDDEGHLYLNIGAPSNACQQEARTPGSQGQDPCPQLERQAGVWQFDADSLGQTQEADGSRYATGIRNAVAIAWNPMSDNLYVVQHGRDQLNTLWSEQYTDEQSAELPSEEFLLVEEGDDFGWPYCYNDHQQGQKVLGPEYGGDGQTVGRCSEAKDPIVAFPGHYAPNDLLFYTAEQFPGTYHQGAFIAFHGSWNRAPLPQRGYQVAFVPMDGTMPTGDWETFADGFTGIETAFTSPGDARYRPTGLALAGDGSIYVSDSVSGRVWRVVYKGNEENVAAVTR